MRIIALYFLIALAIPAMVSSNGIKPFELTPAWVEGIEKIAPEQSFVSPKEARHVLIFTLMTGFQHWATPHTAEVVRILGEKSGAYTAVVSDDIAHFEKEVIANYDSIVLINNCSKKPERHLFYDHIGDMEKAVALEQNLIDYVAQGHGLASIHGGIVIFNNSEEFSELMGGSFEYHPKQTTVRAKVLDPTHPIATAFEGQDFTHHDEPYCLNGAYLQFNFHPLLEMELPDFSKAEQAKVFEPKGQSIRRFISWIKPHGQGRVFYCSPSHNAQSFEDPRLLQFILNGIQYTLGDLDCDDTPIQAQD
ncbi:MAG TPA: glycosyl hydrolase [Opitutae bacterium]|nr:glycosyl hydrolase [Opitutae bacterium]